MSCCLVQRFNPNRLIAGQYISEIKKLHPRDIFSAQNGYSSVWSINLGGII